MVPFGLFNDNRFGIDGNWIIRPDFRYIVTDIESTGAGFSRTSKGGHKRQSYCELHVLAALSR
jgi:hypothetical protein